MALINSPPDVCQSKLEITIFVLVGSLGYSNSAINPVLYGWYFTSKIENYLPNAPFSFYFSLAFLR